MEDEFDGYNDDWYIKRIERVGAEFFYGKYIDLNLNEATIDVVATNAPGEEHAGIGDS